MDVETKKNRKIGIIAVALVAVIVIGIAAVIILKNVYSKVDPFKNIVITESGKSPYITVNVSYENGEDEFLSHVNYNVSQTDKLGTGDIVTITASVSPNTEEKYHKHLTETQMTYTVQTTAAFETINPFDYIEINEDGISPYVNIQYNIIGDDSFVNDINFEISKKYGCYTGETITITASIPEKVAIENEIILEPRTEEYTIQTTQKYITESSELTEALLTQLSEIAEEQVSQKVRTGDIDVIYRYENMLEEHVPDSAHYLFIPKANTVESIECSGKYFSYKENGFYGPATTGGDFYYIYKISASYEDTSAFNYDNTEVFDTYFLICVYEMLCDGDTIEDYQVSSYLEPYKSLDDAVLVLKSGHEMLVDLDKKEE